MGISIVVVRGILSEVRGRGLDPDELLRRSNIQSDRIADIREMLHLREADLLVRTATELTQDPGLGLAIGSRAPESMLQLFGHLVLSHRTIRDAFEAFQLFSGLVVEGPTFDLVEEGELAHFTCVPAVQLGATTRFLMDLTFAMVARIAAHFFVSRRQGLSEVRFQHQRPSYASRYAEVFACPIYFGQSTNALAIPRSLVDAPQLHADDTMRKVLREAAERLLHERTQSRSITDRVRTLLRYEQRLAEVNVERIAGQLGMSARSLRRRLGSEGSPLTALLDEARCRIACEELRRPEATIKETAELLGFSEPSAFHRAFKRWTGRTPAEYSRLNELEVEAEPARERPAGSAGRPTANIQPASRPA